MFVQTIDVEKYRKLKEQTYFRKYGKVAKVVGLTVESVGPDARPPNVRAKPKIDTIPQFAGDCHVASLLAMTYVFGGVFLCYIMFPAMLLF